MIESHSKSPPVPTRFNPKIRANLFGCLDRLGLESLQLLNLWEKMLDMFIMRLIVSVVS